MVDGSRQAGADEIEITEAMIGAEFCAPRSDVTDAMRKAGARVILDEIGLSGHWSGITPSELAEAVFHAMMDAS